MNKNMKKLLQVLFSVTNKGPHKVFTILGFKLKLKLKLKLNPIESQIKKLETVDENCWDKYLIDTQKELLFYDRNLDDVKKKDLFKKYVTAINLETSSFCNRKCNYCPCAQIDRGGQKLMEDSLFSNIIDDLASINYSMVISLNLYNEPLADKKILERIKEIRKKCPNSVIKFNSNGDYLTTKYLDELEAAGLNALFITMQVDSNHQYNDDIQMNKLKKFFEKLKLEFKMDVFIPNEKIESSLYYKRLQLLIMSNNWDEFGNDRGGTVENLSISNRTEPCLRGIREFTIDYQGNCFFCCQIYPLSHDAEKYKLGNLVENSMFEIYCTQFATNLRRNLFTFSSKVEPCSSCADESFAKIETKEIREKIIITSNN